jgi:hypothetical protein
MNNYQHIPPPPPPPPPPYVIVQHARPNVNHTFHLVLTFMTLGMWFPIWMIIWLVDVIRRANARAV